MRHVRDISGQPNLKDQRLPKLNNGNQPLSQPSVPLEPYGPHRHATRAHHNIVSRLRLRSTQWRQVIQLAPFRVA